MLFSNSLAGFIQKPVGKNLDNELSDILKTKQNFARDGRYNKPVENGYIDKELDTAIWNFQRDNDLKADGYMKPGGETERTLLQTLRWRENKGIDLKAEDPGQKNTGMENVSAAALPALAYRLAPLLGMSAAAAWAWYQNLSHSEKQETRQRLKTRELAQPDVDNDGPDCDKSYAKDTKKCSDITSTRGKKAGAICHESAANRYASCLAGKQESQWPPLQD